MKVRRTAVLALSAASLWASAARCAETDTDEQDIRCLAVSIMGLQSANDTVRSTSYVAHIYFLGRLDGRSSASNFEDQIIRSMSLLYDRAILRKETERCAVIMRNLTAKEHAMAESLRTRASETMKNEQ